MSISLEHHPIGYVYDLANRYGDDLVLSFSRYFYRPMSVVDEREEFRVSVLEVTPDWVSRQIELLPDGWELALNSKVLDSRGRAHHVGMIDFVGIPSSVTLIDKLRYLLGATAAREMYLYLSGRSLHGYIAKLMKPKEWREFLGRLLLINFPNEAPVVDSRWVGHRLIGGYSALRWSANSEWHQQMPRRAKIIDF